MKMFQQILREFDKDTIVNQFYYKVKQDCLDGEIYKTLSVQVAIELMKTRISNFIDKLSSMKDVVDSKEENILYCYSYIGFDDLLPMPVTELIHKSDLLANRDSVKSVIPYAYEFSYQSEILGYYVANNPYTLDHLDDLIVDVLYEASFFGYNEEHKQSNIDELAQSASEIEEGLAKFRSWEEVKNEFNDRSKLYSEEQEALRLEKIARESINNYNVYTRCSELSKIVKLLN